MNFGLLGKNKSSKKELLTALDEQLFRFVLIFSSGFLIRIGYGFKHRLQSEGTGELVFHETVFFKEDRSAGVGADTGVGIVEDNGGFGITHKLPMMTLLVKLFGSEVRC